MRVSADLECDWLAPIVLHESTDGDNWEKNDNWSTDASTVPTVSELNAWHGVDIAAGRVVGLTLRSNNLTGPVPPELGRLSSLVELKLERNALSGPVPPELGQFQSGVAVAVGQRPDRPDTSRNSASCPA